MPNFVATAAVTFGFTGASDSTSRTIPSAAAVFLALAVFDKTGDTIASTIAGAAATESYQGDSAGNGVYLAVHVGAPSGSQTVAITGGDAGDLFSCGFRGVDAIDTTDPFDGNVTDTASPASISVTTSADGLGVGVVYAEATSLATSDTEVFEGPDQGPGVVCGVASTPGTGGSVSLDWSGGGAIQCSIAVNFRNAVGTSDDLIVRYGSISLVDGSGLVMAAFASGAAAIALGGGAYFLRRRRWDGLTNVEDK